MFYLLKIEAKSFSEISGSQDICKDTESKHLLASKKEASFSFACGTPRGE